MKLVIRQGPLAGHEFTLAQDVLLIGRSSECDVTIPGEQASRRHAQIHRAGAEVIIADLGTTNGTYVNNRRLWGAASLQPGDEITIGETVLIVQPSGMPHRHPAREGPGPRASPVRGSVLLVVAGGAVGLLVLLSLALLLLWVLRPTETQPGQDTGPTEQSVTVAPPTVAPSIITTTATFVPPEWRPSASPLPPPTRPSWPTTPPRGVPTIPPLP